ncbi:uncharacterized protein LOC110431371 [Sorghum bicolor]|uniref:uncharacterized protein LOC110431371 n=1 Tax=Sorghum bicolor TaxID=4558 RepID=UPI000B424977|nr:uncharacterized protein LOC110431371 [Sorghum bicolor]|eukprot:XP_021306125.1 uncharacterized protein LOC110431371 [Sorghum bicolor]
MASAGAKWKQYKAKLKRQIFDETLTDEQLKNLHGHRIDVHELDSLIKYWRSPESQALAARGKNNRAKLKFLHTSGSVSYASAAHKMGQQLGRPPRRDEVYIKTHTRKNGVPLMPAASTIADLQEVVKVYPELMDRTIQQGDIFAVVCGEKEPRGRVRCLGLGPTPQDIGTPGLKAYSSTKLQIQVLARQQAESENLVLQQRILEMQEREEQSMARESPNVETNSHNGSNSRKHMSPPYEKHAEANQHVQGEEDHDCVGDDYVENEELDDEANQQVPVSSSSTDFFLHAASPAMTSAPARWLSISWDAMTYKWSCVCSA